MSDLGPDVSEQIARLGVAALEWRNRASTKRIRPMGEVMHTKDILAAELHKAGLGDMAIKAASGYYHDFLSPLATPCIQLAQDLLAAGTPEALALHERHINGEFDASKDEGEKWFKEEGQHHIMSSILDRKSAGFQGPKPNRARKPDAQAFDRIEIITVPRYKESELSGDEWRISAAIIFYRKGKEVHRVSARNVEYACRFLDARFMEACDDAKGFFAGEDDICDQEGCAEKAVWRHELKQKYDNRGTPYPCMDGGEYRLFCDRHKTRGDCACEDGDDNYIVTPLSPSPRDGETKETTP